MTGSPNHTLAQRRVQELRPETSGTRRATSSCIESRPARRVLAGAVRGLECRGAGAGANGNATLPPAEGFRCFTLEDGRAVRVRPLRVSDRAKYVEAVAGLSPRSRYLRFAAPIPRMSDRLLDQMMQFDGDRHVVYAAFTPDETAVVGVVRYIRSAHAPQSAEVAIAVADDWQGHGLGRQLFELVVEHARLAGLYSLIATTLTENRVAAQLVRAIGFSLARRAGIYTEYEMHLQSAFAGRDPMACSQGEPAPSTT